MPAYPLKGLHIVRLSAFSNGTHYYYYYYLINKLSQCANAPPLPWLPNSSLIHLKSLHQPTSKKTSVLKSCGSLSLKTEFKLFPLACGVSCAYSAEPGMVPSGALSLQGDLVRRPQHRAPRLSMGPPTAHCTAMCLWAPCRKGLIFSTWSTGLAYGLLNEWNKG